MKLAFKYSGFKSDQGAAGPMDVIRYRHGRLQYVLMLIPGCIVLAQ